MPLKRGPSRPFATADVFTRRRFAGNPVAVVYDASGLESAALQAIAAEFGYPESVFLTSAIEASHTVKARIFTPKTEVPFAGHPLIGAAFLIGRRLNGVDAIDAITFEVGAGLTPARLQIADGVVIGAELDTPQPLDVGPEIDVCTTARLLGLSPCQIDTARHRPMIISVGLPVLAVCVRHDALEAIVPDPEEHATLFPFAGADSVYAYTLDRPPPSASGVARMFSLLDGIGEDPATGSAAAALGALLLHLGRRERASLTLRQGTFISRPSLINVNAWRDGHDLRASLSGRCCTVLEGAITIA